MFYASPYKLGMFERCPKQYQFYVTPEIRDKYKRHSPELTMGNNIHNVLSHFYRYTEKDERTFERLRELLKEKTTQDHKGFKNKEELTLWVEKAKNQLWHFFNNQLAKQEPYLIPEKNLDIELNKDIKLTGKVDRVNKLDEGGLWVVDYKTGKFYEPGIDPKQLHIYAIVVGKKMGVEVRKASYYYLDKDKFFDASLTSDDLKATEQWICDIVAAIQQEKRYEPRMNELCMFCDYQEVCPLWQGKSSEDMAFELSAFKAKKQDQTPRASRSAEDSSSEASAQVDDIPF